MKFVCLLPVRDEADIIMQCLRQLLVWADEVVVFDTGSVDDTWDIVNDEALRDNRIVALRKEPVFFSETRLRGWMFHQARKRMRTGDWFLRVDADEFHHVSPPEFVKTRVKRHETIVYHQYYNFCLLDSEVAGWDAGTETLADRVRPIEERRQWYIPSIYSEPRLCRYRESMQWPPTVSFPFNAGFVAVERMPIRHYPHRDPVQLERRCLLRAIMMADKENRSNWTSPDRHHWAQREWRKFITPDNADGVIRWVPGTRLEEVRLLNHLPKMSTRLTQRLTHSCLLGVLDRFRPHWMESAYPQPIPPEIVAQLEQELKK